MTIQNDGTMSINRGDIIKSPLFINGGDTNNPIRYSIIENPNTIVYFSIMYPNQSFEEGVIRKVFTINDANQFGDVVIYVPSSETLMLQQGKYYYQIKAKLESGEINTITNKEVLYVR